LGFPRSASCVHVNPTDEVGLACTESMGWTPAMIETNMVGSEGGETMTRQQIGRALYALANRGLVVKERDGYHLTDAGLDALPSE
jgi:hypothetical protein